MLGSQLLIAGAVTEFEQQAGGGGLRLGIGSGIFGGALGGTTTNGIVGMDIRLIDTTIQQDSARPGDQAGHRAGRRADHEVHGESPVDGPRRRGGGQSGVHQRGTNTGLKAGDVFTVTAVVRELTDPSSGAVLGIVAEKRGEIEVVNVQEKFSVAVMKTPFQAARGDLVKLTGGAR